MPPVIVNDTLGDRQSGVIITVASEDGRRITSGMTDSQGRFEQFITLPVNHDRIDVYAGILGRVSQKSVDIAAAIEVTFE